MTNQQLADCLLHHWQNLWPLPAAERIKRIDELGLDMEFENQLSLVSVEMANPEFA
jgi:predicted component of type VI protein secretion system